MEAQNIRSAMRYRERGEIYEGAKGEGGQQE